MNNKNLFFVLFALVGLLALIDLVLCFPVFFQRQTSTTPINQDQTLVSQALQIMDQRQAFSWETNLTPSPPLPSPSVIIKISILNGSGTPGAAADLKNRLDQVSTFNTSVGNTTRIEQTTLDFKPNLPPTVKDLLLELLAFPSPPETKETLSLSSPVDALITLGTDNGS
ncbi:MAG: LytR C-terminal domain-containing protein [Candidatus Shapirobacteria bacterium]